MKKTVFVFVFMYICILINAQNYCFTDELELPPDQDIKSFCENVFEP